MPKNPFVGAWSTAERNQIAFRDDTLVINPPDAPPTAMTRESCPQGFDFRYGRKSREAADTTTTGGVGAGVLPGFWCNRNTR